MWLSSLSGPSETPLDSYNCFGVSISPWEGTETGKGSRAQSSKREPEGRTLRKTVWESIRKPPRGLISVSTSFGQFTSLPKRLRSHQALRKDLFFCTPLLHFPVPPSTPKSCHFPQEIFSDVYLQASVKYRLLCSLVVGTNAYWAPVMSHKHLLSGNNRKTRQTWLLHGQGSHYNRKTKMQD